MTCRRTGLKGQCSLNNMELQFLLFQLLLAKTLWTKLFNWDFFVFVTYWSCIDMCGFQKIATAVRQSKFHSTFFHTWRETLSHWRWTQSIINTVFIKSFQNKVWENKEKFVWAVRIKTTGELQLNSLFTKETSDLKSLVFVQIQCEKNSNLSITNQYGTDNSLSGLNHM